MFELPVAFLPVETAIAWLATFLLHSTLLLGGVWLVSRRLAGRSLAVEETLWKSALVGAVVTASLQVAILAPAGWGLASVKQADLPAAASNSGQQVGPAAERSPRAAESTLAMGSPIEPAALVSEVPNTYLAPSPDLAAAGPAARLGSAESRLPGWQRMLFAGWLLGAAFLCLLFAVSWIRLSRRLKHRRQLEDGPARGQLDRLIELAGSQDTIRLSAAEALTVPIALGTTRREICVPDRALDGLEADELESLLAHELAHVLRRDPAWLLACRALESVLFVQPLVRVARKRLQTIAEFRCDAWASALTERPVVLARVLTEVASWLRGPRAARSGLLVPSMASDPSRLGSRVRRILEQGGLAHVRGPKWVVPAAVGVLLSVAFMVPGLSPTVMAGEATESTPFVHDALVHDEYAEDHDAELADAGDWADDRDHDESSDCCKGDWSERDWDELGEYEADELTGEIAELIEMRVDGIADLVGDAIEASQFGHEIVGDVLADSFDAHDFLDLDEILEPVRADLDRVVAEVAAGVDPTHFGAPALAGSDRIELSDAEENELAAMAAEIAESVVVDEAGIARIVEMAESIARRVAPTDAEVARLKEMAAKIAERAGPSGQEMARFEALAAEIAERATPSEAELESLMAMAERAEADELTAEERDRLRAQAREMAERMRPNREELERLRVEARRLVESSRPSPAELDRLRAEARRLVERSRPSEAEIDRLRAEALELAERVRPDRAELERLRVEARRRAEEVMERSQEMRERESDRERNADRERAEVRRREVETRREIERRVDEARERVRELERENERLREELRQREESSEPPQR